MIIVRLAAGLRQNRLPQSLLASGSWAVLLDSNLNAIESRECDRFTHTWHVDVISVLMQDQSNRRPLRT